MNLEYLSPKYQYYLRNVIIDNENMDQDKRMLYKMVFKLTYTNFPIIPYNQFVIPIVFMDVENHI